MKDIQKNDDEYLTPGSEAQAANNESESIPVDRDQILRIIGEEIFSTIYSEKKYIYNNHYHFDFNKIIDDYYLTTAKNKIGVRIITPLFDLGKKFSELDLKMMSARENSLIIRMRPDTAALQELQAVLQIQSLPARGGAAGAGEVAERRAGVRSLLVAALREAEYYVNAKRVDLQAANPVERINSGLKLLIDSLYHKINYITSFTGSGELQDLVLGEECQLTLVNAEEESNQAAIEEIRDYLEMSNRRNLPVTMKNLLDKYAGPPYGWLSDDIRGLVLRLCKNQELKLQLDEEQIVPTDQNLLQYMVKRGYVDRLFIKKRTKTPEILLNNAGQLIKAVFNVSNLPADEDGLMQHFKALAKNELGKVNRLLIHYKEWEYPGKGVLDNGKTLLQNILQIRNNLQFYEKLYELKEELPAFAANLIEIKKFFEKQRGYFDRALHDLDVYNKNKTYVLDEEIIRLVGEIEGIIQAHKPYGLISRLPGLLDTFRKRFVQLLDKEMEPVRGVIEIDRQKVMTELDLHPFRAGLAPAFHEEFKKLLAKLEACNNFYDALAMKEESDRLKLRCFAEIEKKRLERMETENGTAEPGPECRGKEVVNISIANIFHGARTIDTEEDLEQLLDYLRQQLKKELKENTRLKLI
ncbi:MAG: hypothetical protein AB1796_11780 [Bacillota bacterium]